MPIYEYQCEGCGKAVELLVLGSTKNLKCPHCSSSKLQRLFSVFAAHQGASKGADACASASRCPSSSRNSSACRGGGCPYSSGH